MRRRYLCVITGVFAQIVLCVLVFGQPNIYSPSRTDTSFQHDTSPPLWQLVLNHPAEQVSTTEENHDEEGPENPDSVSINPLYNDPLRQTNPGAIALPALISNFDGINYRANELDSTALSPPDPNGDAGRNYYVQIVNSAIEVFDKSGNSLLGPARLAALWDGFTGPWTDHMYWDPIVLFDPLANRWVMSMSVSSFWSLSFPGSRWILIAVSVTDDPRGQWYRYAFLFYSFQDYQKLAVWPDAYYLSVKNPDVVARAFQRDSMLTGKTPKMIEFTGFSDCNTTYTFLPSDFDGPPPPPGTPNYFCYIVDGEVDTLGIYELHADWSNINNSTFTGPTVFSSSLSPPFYLAPFNLSGAEYKVPQFGLPHRVDDCICLDVLFASELMYRVQYRNFGSYQTLVTNHTVNIGGDTTGIRWYEFRNAGNGWTIHQQGTYGPSDGLYRWMGSIAMDSSGNIALGYTAGSDNSHVSVRYTGRYSSDSLGKMTATEVIIDTSTGVAWENRRWGDYSMLTVDPTDDKTFWFTHEYLTQGNPLNLSYSPWCTRIASFRIINPPDPPTLSCPHILDSAGTSPTLTWNASSGANTYRLQVASDSTFTTLNANVGGITSLSYTINGLTGNMTYYWHVKASDSEGTSDWSSFSRFIASPPRAPNLTAHGEAPLEFSQLTGNPIKQLNGHQMSLSPPPYPWLVWTKSGCGVTYGVYRYYCTIRHGCTDTIGNCIYSGTDTSYIDSTWIVGMDSSHTAHYYVKATAGGLSSFSNRIYYGTGQDQQKAGLVGRLEIPKEYTLLQAYPNPFNPTATIEYQLPAISKVSLKVYNLLGQVVQVLKDDVEGPGYKEVQWNASSVGSGVYLYIMESSYVTDPAKTFKKIRKMILMK